MEYFIIAGGFYIVSGALISIQSRKYNRNPTATFLMSICTTPIGAYLFLKEGLKKGIKRTRKRGPWIEWIAKAEHLQATANLEEAQDAYNKALHLLKEALSNGSSNEKYLRSKISEINYALNLIEFESNDTTKVVKLTKHHGMEDHKRL